MYKVTSDIKLKVQGVIKVFPIGSVIKLPEKSAQIFIQQGKLVPVSEPKQTTFDDLLSYFEEKGKNKNEFKSEALNERMVFMGENCEPGQTEPYVTEFGVLVIPDNSDKKYHYWAGGQTVCETLKELGRCDLIENYKSIYN